MASGEITPSFLSESTNGRQILVTATATPGTLLHTCAAGTDQIEALTLEAVNKSGSTVTLTIEWGGTTDPNDLTTIDVPSGRGPIVVIDRRRMNNGLAIRAFASTGSVVAIYGEADTWDLT